MKTIPIGNRVLVRLDKNEKEIGGIIIPDILVKETNTGVVVELGTGKLNKKGKPIPWNVKVGDHVVVKNTLDKIEWHANEEKLIAYRQEEIIGIIGG